MIIQIHILQNYAPANLNRDDTGSPKDAIFGGKRRGRISSQCLKRSIRRSEAFETVFRSTGMLAVRTKRLPVLIEAELKALGTEDETIAAIVEKVPLIGRESTKKGREDDGPDDGGTESAAESEKETKQLIFIAPNEVPALAKRLLEIFRKTGSTKWKKLKAPEITQQLEASLPKSVDIAMFGRMTTSAAFEDVQAAVQVAHAISTNALTEEFDYYTAVDDLSGETGAGMIGDVEFNSSTYYKYLNVHWEKLVENLGGDVDAACAAVGALLEAAATAQPTGKQNTFAAFNLPDLVLVEVYPRNLPVSYANAFLKPVKETHQSSLMDASIAALDVYVQKISQAYDLAPERAFISLNDGSISGGESLASLGQLKGWLQQRLPVEN